ncbi:hypothetical protein Pmani_016122 [Petrolisthes manimaculis]|uniref:Uncharacterized protein n=1 Tax=Petrolisthes manimaculis TaxID=1843537 RepID=A0AAE1PQE3_9EUCA|nr:hypothetical protein Pmani_016122 [Petrolisthes manimaculis]
MAPPTHHRPRKISHSCSAGTLPTYTELQVGGDGLLLVPVPTRPPSTHQGHAYITHGNAFLRVWVEIRTTSLHIYPHEAATLPTLVVAHLDQCDVTLTHDVIAPPPPPNDVIAPPPPHDVIAPPPLHDVISFSHLQRHLNKPPYRVTVALKGCEQVSLYHYNPREAEVWSTMLKITTVHRSLQLEGLNLECGVAGAEEDSGDSCPNLRKTKDDTTRRELLQQMLATKTLLEKKLKNSKSGAGAWALTAGEVVNEYDRAQHQAQQSALRKAVILRQRKNSTAIKMATLEKQEAGKKKKKKKKVGKDVVCVQLEALRRRLSSLDTQLRESEQDTERTLQHIEHRRNQDLHIIKDLGGVDDGGLEGVALGCSGGGGSNSNSEEKPLIRNTLMGSLSSIPSIIISSSEKTEKKITPEKIFGFRVGGVSGGGGGVGVSGVNSGVTKTRNPLHFLDLKLRVSRRHKSTENLMTPTHTYTHTHTRTHTRPHQATTTTPTLQRSDNNNNPNNNNNNNNDDAPLCPNLQLLT